MLPVTMVIMSTRWPKAGRSRLGRNYHQSLFSATFSKHFKTVSRPLLRPLSCRESETFSSMCRRSERRASPPKGSSLLALAVRSLHLEKGPSFFPLLLKMSYEPPGRRNLPPHRALCPQRGRQ